MGGIIQLHFCFVSIALQGARIYAGEVKCIVHRKASASVEEGWFWVQWGAGEPSSGSQYSNAREERRAIMAVVSFRCLA